MEMYWCPNCGAMEDHTAYYSDPEAGVEKEPICAVCGEPVPEELKQCPTCDNGWVMPGDMICEDCMASANRDLKAFFSRFSKPYRAYMDYLLEDASVEEFVCEQ